MHRLHGVRSWVSGNGNLGLSSPSTAPNRPAGMHQGMLELRSLPNASADSPITPKKSLLCYICRGRIAVWGTARSVGVLEGETGGRGGTAAGQSRLECSSAVLLAVL